MTTRRTRLQDVTRPRLANQAELAFYLGMSPNTFRAKAEELRRAGLPQPDPLIGLWDLDAIDRWLDGRRGLLDGRPGPGQAFESDLDKAIESYGNN